MTSKKLIILFIFLLGVYFIKRNLFSNRGQHMDLSSLNISVLDADNSTINLSDYIRKNKIKLIYFYNQNSCESCFLVQNSNLERLSNNPDFIIITNLKLIRELKAFSYSYKLPNSFIFSKQDKTILNLLNKGSFYYDIKKEKYFTPDTNKRNYKEKTASFLKEYINH